MFFSSQPAEGPANEESSPPPGVAAGCCAAYGALPRRADFCE